MTKYKRIDAKNGRKMFYVDGKMTSKEDIPTEIMEKLSANTEIEADTQPRQDHFDEPDVKLVDRKVCIFDGKPAVTERFINEQLIGLCEDHRFGKTVGEIAQAVREK